MSRQPVPNVVLGVRRFLDGPHGPPQGSHGLIAVSGGADSTALTHALAALAPSRVITLTIGHVDHGLRPTSPDDARRVRALGDGLGLSVRVANVTIDPTRAVEETARRLRYRALDRLADEVGASWIATGHSLDDQVETVLLRLTRGAGRGGLAGMRPRRGRILRPMLEVTRADVRWYLGSLGAVPVEDPGNADLRFARNRVRHLLIPLMERELNGDFSERLAALAGRLRDEDDLLSAMAADRARALEVGVELPVVVAKEPPAIARRIVRTWLERAGAGAGSSHHVDAVLSIATGAGGRSVSVPSGERITRVGAALVREPAEDADCAPFALAVTPGATLEGPPNAPWSLAFSACMPRPTQVELPTDASRAVFDVDRLPGTLVVRSVRPGDRMTLPGVGTRKLQDLLVDFHVPRRRRGMVPIVTAGDEIAWVPGIARSATAPVVADTAHLLEAALQHGEVFGLPVKNRCDSLPNETRVTPARRR